MSDHLIDIVDENNVPTDEQLPRSVVHERKLWHRGAIVYLFRNTDSDIEILIHHRSTTKDVSPDKLAPGFGGHVEAGETYDEAIIEELQEELGLKLTLSELTKGSITKENVSHEFFQHYFLEYNEKLGKIKPEPNEIQSTEWMSQKDIIESIEQTPEKWTRTSVNLVNIIKSIN
ncbi:NUDIX domain-containing protein [Patescibacteria group bacterium]